MKTLCSSKKVAIDEELADGECLPPLDRNSFQIDHGNDDEAQDGLKFSDILGYRFNELISKKSGQAIAVLGGMLVFTCISGVIYGTGNVQGEFPDGEPLDDPWTSDALIEVRLGPNPPRHLPALNRPCLA
jgi:hypothetical protein